MKKPRLWMEEAGSLSFKTIFNAHTPPIWNAVCKKKKKGAHQSTPRINVCQHITSTSQCNVALRSLTSTSQCNVA